MRFVQRIPEGFKKDRGGYKRTGFKIKYRPAIRPNHRSVKQNAKD